MRRALALIAVVGCGSTPPRREPVAAPPEPAAPEIEVIAEGVLLDHLASDGDHLYWQDDRGVIRHPLDGGADEVVEDPGLFEEVERTFAGLPVWAMASDDLGTVVMTAETILEHRRDEVLVVLVPDDRWITPRAVALARGKLYVTARRAGDGVTVVLEVPRVSLADVAHAVPREVADLAADDGRVCWLEHARDDRGFVVCDGAQLATLPAVPAGLTVDDDRVYAHDVAAIYEVPARGGEVVELERPGDVHGITAHNGYLYWLDAEALYARKRGGATVRFADGLFHAGVPELAFDDDHVYVRGADEELDAVSRVDRRGRIERLWTGEAFGRGLAVIDRDVYLPAIVGEARALLAISPDGDARVAVGLPASAQFVRIVAADGAVFALIHHAPEELERIELLRIDPASGETTTLLRWAHGTSAPPQLAVTDQLAYVELVNLGVILRIPTT